VPRIIGTLIGVCVGIVFFYFPAAYAACGWFWPASNLCGLPAMMIAAPIGAVVGGIVGWRLTGRSKASELPPAARPE
jgi:hypothetical protein